MEMNRLEYKCVCELAEHVLETYGDIKDDYPLLGVYGHFNVIKELLEYLVREGYSLERADIENPDLYDYKKEYALYLSPDGIAVEKCWYEANEYHEAGYCWTGANVVLVHEDCNCKLLSRIESDEIYEFGYVEEEVSPVHIEYLVGKNNQIFGFTATKTTENGCFTYSQSSSDGFTEEEIEKILELNGF